MQQETQLAAQHDEEQNNKEDENEEDEEDEDGSQGRVTAAAGALAAMVLGETVDSTRFRTRPHYQCWAW